MNYVSNFTFTIIMIIFGVCSIAEAQSEKSLNRRSKINSFIEEKLDKEFSKILSKDHYQFYVRVSSRDRKLLPEKDETMHLGKLGDQALRKKKKRAVYENLPLTKRLTDVDVVLFIHPTVEKSSVKQMKSIIMNETPFVSLDQINIFQYKMVAYPQYFNSSHILEDFKYWYKLNNELGDSIFRYLSVTLIIFILVGFSWYMAFRRTQKLEQMIHSLTSEKDSPQGEGKEIEKEILYLSNQVGDDRVKYFFRDLKSEDKEEAS